MSSVLDQLQEQEKSEREAAQAKYDAILEQLATGSADPELGVVAAAMRLVDKTSADLAADVADRKRIMAMEQQVAAADKAATELDTIAAEIAAADAELDAAKQAHRQKIFPLVNRKNDIHTIIMAAQQPKYELAKRQAESAGVQPSRQSTPGRRKPLEAFGFTIEQ